MSHTPGPWTREGRFVTAGGLYVADVMHTGPEKSVPRGEQAEANARLIAAAPEMLAALREIAATAESKPYAIQKIVRAAIAKAVT